MEKDTERLVTTGEAARMMRVSRERVAALIREHRLPVAMTDGFGRRYLDPGAVRKLVEDYPAAKRRSGAATDTHR